MTYEELLQILALLNGKAGGQITGADLSRVDDPMLGVLTNTYNAQQNSGPNLADLSTQYRPTWESLQNQEYYNEESVERQISSSLASGVPLMEVRKQIPQFLANSGQPFGPNDSTTQELLAFATKLDGEQRDYTTAVSKANTDRSTNSWWAKAGIRDPSLRVDSTELIRPELEKLLKLYMPNMSASNSNVTGGYTGSEGKRISGNTQPSAEGDARAARKKESEAKGEAEAYAQKYLPYNPMATKQYVERFVSNAIAPTDDSRERERMIVRRDAMGKRPSQKSSIPDRSDQLKKESEKQMLEVAAIIQQRGEREAAKMRTPAQEDIMGRILALAAAEKLTR